MIYKRESIPSKVQGERVKRNRIRLVSEADSNAVDIKYAPADAADNGKYELHSY
jgi:hypothetical protein